MKNLKVFLFIMTTDEGWSLDSEQVIDINNPDEFPELGYYDSAYLLRDADDADIQDYLDCKREVLFSELEPSEIESWMI